MESNLSNNKKWDTSSLRINIEVPSTILGLSSESNDGCILNITATNTTLVHIPVNQLSCGHIFNISTQYSSTISASILANFNNQSLMEVEIECSNVNSEHLQDLFNTLRSMNSKITSLVVRDSNLSSLNNLPLGVHELKKLTLSNTSIDLEVLKEGSESLRQLSSLEILNEKISNIPRNFFQEMLALRELRLENDSIASLDADAFHNLEDSLEYLFMQKNRFNRFPMAVKNLAQLQVLDLLENDIVIDTQDYDLPNQLEPLLQLRELRIARFNCTCDFGWSPFYEWIANTHISGVRCNAPEKLKGQEIIVLRRDELCEISTTSASSKPTIDYKLLVIYLLYLPVLFHCWIY